MKKVLTIVFVLGLAGAFGGTLYYLRKKSQKPPVVYATKSPTRTDIIKKTVATGSVVPRKEVEIKAQVSGIVDALMIEAGAIVARDAPIARIRLVPNMVALNDAESRVNRARIRKDDASRELRRQRDLAKQGTISDATLQQAEVDAATTDEELLAAVSNLELIKEGSSSRSGTTSNTVVKATISGMVLELPLEVGASVIEANNFNAGTTIATIADMSDMIFEGKVDEAEVGKVAPSMPLILTIGAIDDQHFDATLEHIAPKGVEEDGAVQFEIRAAIAKPPEKLIRANLSATADIVLDRRDGVLAIEESLLQFEGDKPYVEVETAPQKFERREIEVGLSDGITIEVLSGLSETDKIKDPGSAKAS